MRVADDPSSANTNALTKDDNVAIPSLVGPDGVHYLAVYCDIPALWAAFPHDAFAELNARVVLEMAQSNGLGVIVQAVSGERTTQAVVSPKDVVEILSGKFSETVVVPPGHKVVVIEPRPNPYFSQRESGVWIAELGSGKNIDEIVTRVRKLSEQAQRATVVWIVQPILLESPTVFEAVLAAFRPLLSDARKVIAHSAVVPYAGDRHAAMMRRLKDIGMSVYYGGPHGECFVEVHKPEGIVVGMPGRPFA